MKTAGALVLICGLVAAAVLALWPTSVTVLGTSIDCSSPIRRVISKDEPTGDEFQDQIVSQCRSQSWTRIIIGGVVGFGTLLGGLVMLVSGGNSGPRRKNSMPLMMPVIPMAGRVPPGWHPDPDQSTPGAVRWWDGSQWTDRVGRPTSLPPP